MQLDSPRFNWTTVEIPEYATRYCSAPWMSDTDEVFFVASESNNIFHYKSGNYNYIEFPSNRTFYDIKGLSPTEGYLFGATYKEGLFTPYFQKWDGHSFNTIPVNITSEKLFRPRINSTFLRNRNEMWLSSPGVAWKFDGYNMIPYTLPDSAGFPLGFFDKYNRLKCYYFIRNDQDTTETYTICEFNGQSWNAVYEHTQSYSYYYSYPYYGFYIIGNSMMILATEGGQNDLYELTGNNTLNLLQSFLFTNQYLTLYYPLGGNPPNDILFFAHVPNNLATIMVHWNGEKYSLENPLSFDVFYLQFGNYSNNFWCVIWDNGSPIPYHNLLMIGRRKNFTNKN